MTFVEQSEPRGYADAIACAREFVGDESFLHLVGDHLWVARGKTSCAEQLVRLAESESAAVSAVQATRETMLPYYGTVGGRRVGGRDDLYLVERVRGQPEVRGRHGAARDDIATYLEHCRRPCDRNLV